MHEFSVCRGLIRQVERVALENDAVGIKAIVLDVGVLSGVEAELLGRAFEVARHDTLAAEAELVINAKQASVHCEHCGYRGEAAANRLVCPVCDNWKVELTGGDQMLLRSIDIIEKRGVDAHV